MPYFSRLTDIVTCNLTSILEHTDEPQVALEEILFEMKEGLAGAERSVKTATANVARIELEIGQLRQQVQQWQESARDDLAAGNEMQARNALQRKHEVEDLVAGLEQELASAVSTRDHLKTILNALQARLADAKRRLQALETGTGLADRPGTVATQSETLSALERQSRVDAELEALRKQLDSP